MVVSATESVAALMAAAGTVGAVHTWLGPDHYLPFVGFAVLERWSLRKTLAVVAAAGLAHCALAVPLVLGAAGLAGLLELQLGLVRPIGWLTVGLGLALLVSALRRGRAPRRGAAGARLVWCVAFVLGPCEWLWPCALPALHGHGVGGMLLVSAAFALATVAAMAAAVALGTGVLARWRPSPRAGQVCAGALLVASGGALLAGL